MIPKWDPRARMGIYVGRSPSHASNVGLILNPRTGHVSPQFHVVYDDNFTTVPYLRTNKVPPHWAQLIEESSNFYQPAHEIRPSTWQSLFIESEPEEGDFNSDAELLRQPKAEATNSAQEARSSLALDRRKGVSATPQTTVSFNDAAINDPSILTSPFHEAATANANQCIETTSADDHDLIMPTAINLEQSGLRRSRRIAELNLRQNPSTSVGPGRPSAHAKSVAKKANPTIFGLFCTVEKYEIKLHSEPFRGVQTSERKGGKLSSTNELIILLEAKASLASTKPSAARYFTSLQTSCREPMLKESMASSHREGDMNQSSSLATSPSEKTAGQGSIKIFSFQSIAKSAGAGLPSSDPKTIQRKLIIVASIERCRALEGEELIKSNIDDYPTAARSAREPSSPADRYISICTTATSFCTQPRSRDERAIGKVANRVRDPSQLIVVSRSKIPSDSNKGWITFCKGDAATIKAKIMGSFSDEDTKCRHCPISSNQTQPNTIEERVNGEVVKYIQFQRGTLYPQHHYFVSHFMQRSRGRAPDGAAPKRSEAE